MDNIQKLVDLLHTQVQSCNKCAQNSKEPNDGSFIQYDKKIVLVLTELLDMVKSKMLMIYSTHLI